MSPQLDGAQLPKPVDAQGDKNAPRSGDNNLNLLSLTGDKSANPKATDAKPAPDTKPAKDAKQTKDLQEAEKELSESITRLQTDPVEAGAVDLAKTFAQSAVRGDLKALQKLLKDNLGSDALDDALDIAKDSLSDAGIHLDWSQDKLHLMIARYPSIYLKGPEGAALHIPAQGKVEAFKVERKALKAMALDSHDPFEFKPSASSPDAVAADLGKTAAHELAEQRKGVKDAIESVKLYGAIEHAGGFNKKPEGVDQITPLATALLEKRFSPLARAVLAAETEGAKIALAEQLNTRLEAVGLNASYDEKEGFCVFTYSSGVTDGYSIHFPSKKGGRIESFELRGPKHEDPSKNRPAVWRIVEEGKDVEAVPLSDAMRGFNRKLLETRRAQNY